MSKPIIPVEIVVDHEQTVSQRWRQDLLQNTKTVCISLAEHGFAQANVPFDGSGDEGDTGYVSVYTSSDLQRIAKEGRRHAVLSLSDLPVPDISVAIVDTYPSDKINVQLMSLEQALKDTADKIIELGRSGWCDGPGAYGTVTFDVASKTASLEFNQRFHLESQHTRILSDTTSFEEIDPKLFLNP